MYMTCIHIYISITCTQIFILAYNLQKAFLWFRAGKIVYAFLYSFTGPEAQQYRSQSECGIKGKLIGA